MPDIESLLKEKRVFKPSREFGKQANWNKKTVAEYRKLGAKDPSASGRRWRRRTSAGSRRGRRCSTGSRRSPSGSSAASSTSPTTASTGTSKENEGRGGATRRRSSGRASPATRASSRTPSCTARSAASPTCSRARASRRAIASRSTCRWCPSSPIAMLACTRIGAPHSIVFGGFSADALRDRINDAGAKLVITADGGYRKGAPSRSSRPSTRRSRRRPSVEKVDRRRSAPKRPDRRR